MSVKIPRNETRTFEQIKKHYELEKKLAKQLLSANKEQRKNLYTSLYNELFQKIPEHPQLQQKNNANASTQAVARKMRLVNQYLKPDSIFMELGPGDCQLSLTIAKQVKQVYAIDVSSEIVEHIDTVKNFDVIISDGCMIPVPENTVTVAYSNQLMEHLHPDDALEQLQNIYQALAVQGYYICITPNRLCGPHDVSQYFDEVATGFHLKEYTITELSELFYQIGFRKLEAYIGGKGFYLKFPLSLLKQLETWLTQLPNQTQKKISKTLPLRALLGVILVAQK